MNNNKDKKVIEVAKKYGYCPLFADTNDLQETWDNTIDLINSMKRVSGIEKMHVITGLSQMINYYCLLIAERDIEIEKSKIKE